jgi:uncharacterized membrane protein YgdD (TMEM256/DUF423 family)
MHWSSLGAQLVAVAVLIGAFGAHALRERLDPYATGIYERAVFYHFIHGLGILAAGIAIQAHVAAAGPATLAAWFLLAGIVIFSGSLYALALSGNRKLGAITPIGGVAFVVGWLILAYALSLH